MSAAVQPFVVTGPLPRGTTVLEASAGTGKTWTLAALVTRWVAEGHARLDQVLAVTFSRAATAELRTRVRERLRDVLAALEDPDVVTSDPVALLLRNGSAQEVEQRRRRLRAAVAGFDGATVATTHEFCSAVLRGLGTAADLDPGTALLEDLSELVTETADDLLLRAADAGIPLPCDRDAAQQLAAAAVADGEAVLLPLERAPGSPADLRVRFAESVRTQVRERCRAARVLGYDDLLVRVRDALRDPVTGPVAAARLRERYRVVLVDEFQDTDPVQWEVLRLAFVGHVDLLVIGDPKQAVYAFRGADVQAYLHAAGSADARCDLDTNWRSDAALLGGLQALWRGAALGDDRIVVRPVRAAHAAPLLRGRDAPAVQLRVLPRADLRPWKGRARSDPARQAVAADVAQQARALLAEGLAVHPRDGSGQRALVARDVAVLVRTGRQAAAVREALLAAGVPCVLTGTSSVFGTPAAEHWLALLQALEQPHRTGRVRRLALTPLGGLGAADLVGEAGERHADALASRLRGWGELLGRRGVAALFEVVAQEQDLGARLLAVEGGERLLTDLRHVAEVLHRQASGAGLGLAGLGRWLRERVERAGSDADAERSRRLDTDAHAVQVLTVHASKGLEFPVVLVPFGWDPFTAPGEPLPRGHAPDGGRTRWVGGEGPGLEAAGAEEARASAGEELRLLYVATTRAVSRLVLWWVAGWATQGAPLHRLLLTPEPGTGVPEQVDVPDDEDLLERVRALGGVAVEQVPVPGPPAAVPAPPAGAAEELRAAELGRSLDLAWRRASYTSLTRDAHEAPVRTEAQEDVKDDEPSPDEGDPADGPDRATGEGVPSPLDAFPGGTGFGTLVHEVLEVADLAGDDAALSAALAAAVRAAGRGRPGAADPRALATALLPALSTPLGPLAGGRAFRDLAARDRVAELAFELPLAGGDDAGGSDGVLLAGLGDVLEAGLPPGDPVRAWAPRLREPVLGGQVLRGYLTGSLDAVVRADGRYLVVDHKTNRLAPAGVPLTSAHYRREALDAAVAAADYPLQALLYVVALHRFLRWRQPGYAPQRHLGGVLYLFLRGMCGPGADRDEGAGVWAWSPPAEVVLAASDLLAGEGA